MDGSGERKAREWKGPLGEGEDEVTLVIPKLYTPFYINSCCCVLIVSVCGVEWGHEFVSDLVLELGKKLEINLSCYELKFLHNILERKK